MKLLITNIVYGQVYAGIFLNQHLKSILDKSNLPSIVPDCEVKYILYTDHHTKFLIEYHPMWIALSKLVKTEIKFFDTNLTFEGRYTYLRSMLIDSMKIAMEGDYILSPIVADLYFAKDFYPRILKRFKEGYDSVLVTGMRSSAEAMIPRLNQSQGALTDMELFDYGYECLHPLWVACHWDAVQFSRIPYVLLWNAYPGFMLRAFSVTPIAFIPNSEMLDCNMIDADVPYHCKKPFWALDWVDAPVMGIEPLECFYPPFSNHKATTKYVGIDFASKALNPKQYDFLKVKSYFPCKERVKLSDKQIKQSDNVVKEILEYVESSKRKAS